MIPEAIFLLPCPMCGTPPDGPTRMRGFGADWLIRCPDCQVKLERFAETNGPDDPVPAQMIEAWNRRVSPTPIQATAQSDSLI